ncbi:MAG: cysteine-rich CWC family protein [Flavobacteriales bacterium]|nr:cysteine-rich CWC family protein [Flavobacteriales bacterium]
MEKTCPRCGKTFECRHQEIDKCWCMSQAIEPDALAYISGEYTGCLCKDCIEELNRKARLKLPMDKKK